MWRKRLRVWRDSRSMPRPSICLPWRARAAGAAASVERQQGPFRQARGPCHCLRFTRAKATASETRAGMVAASVVQQSKQCFLFQIFVIWRLVKPRSAYITKHTYTPKYIYTHIYPSIYIVVTNIFSNHDNTHQADFFFINDLWISFSIIFGMNWRSMYCNTRDGFTAHTCLYCLCGRKVNFTFVERCILFFPSLSSCTLTSRPWRTWFKNLDLVLTTILITFLWTILFEL